MAHNRKKMPFYEAMSKTHFKPGYSKKLEKLHPEEPDKSAKSESVTTGRATQLWRKPRVVQFNPNKIEFSVSYPVAFAIVLGIILLIVAAFRLGQAMIPASAAKIPKAVPVEPAGQLISDTPQTVDKPVQLAPAAAPVAKKTEPAPPKGGNTIVLVEYQTRADLVPVQRHFARYGIETEIVSWAGRYFLITKDRYDGFGVGSDGYEAKRKIVEVGALYEGKAPEGYETFAPHFFKDAYGKKVE